MCKGFACWADVKKMEWWWGWENLSQKIWMTLQWIWVGTMVGKECFEKRDEESDQYEERKRERTENEEESEENNGRWKNEKKGRNRNKDGGGGINSEGETLRD